MEKIVCKNSGWNVVKTFEGWTLGILRYCQRFSKCGEMERHLLTDEVFVLLEGTATLITEEGAYPMEKNALYNIPKGEWHHIVVSEDATVLVAENSNTAKENTEKRYFAEETGGQPC